MHRVSKLSPAFRICTSLYFTLVVLTEIPNLNASMQVEQRDLPEFDVAIGMITVPRVETTQMPILTRRSVRAAEILGHPSQKYSTELIDLEVPKPHVSNTTSLRIIL
jgi:hypothetical protein